MNESNDFRGELPIVVACRALYEAIDRLDEVAATRMRVARSDLRCLNLLERGAVTPSRISGALGLSTGSVTALIDRLEKKGLVQRVRDPVDRRSVSVEATPRVFEELGPIYKTVAIELARTVSVYSKAERSMAVRHLNDVTRACEAAIAKVGRLPNDRAWE